MRKQSKINVDQGIRNYTNHQYICRSWHPPPLWRLTDPLFFCLRPKPLNNQSTTKPTSLLDEASLASGVVLLPSHPVCTLWSGNLWHLFLSSFFSPLYHIEMSSLALLSVSLWHHCLNERRTSSAQSLRDRRCGPPSQTFHKVNKNPGTSLKTS